jgi:ATP-dependent RNA helicase DHX57
MAPKKKAPKATNNDTVPGSDHIVFAKDGAKERRKTPATPGPDAQEGPPKLDARKIIGGNSWTGKLPQTLLNELCQKQKWNRPDFSMRKMPEVNGGGYRSTVKLSRTDPKTKETTSLPPFHLPDSHAHLADQPTVLEARHFAAAYALFRVSSMKNIHMMLPPFYRDLWKGEFTQLKTADVADNKAWKYDADPFAADAKRHEIHVSIEKRRTEREKADAKAATSMVLPDRSRAWARAVKVEMGQQIRNEVEALVREHAMWNPYGISLSSRERDIVINDLSCLGFRLSHVQEAVMYCKDREETLEWLLVHVPEDDLPNWCLPPGYSAGISLASGNLEREAKLKRLSEAGYSFDLCATALQQNHEDEGLAAEYLQNTLVALNPSSLPQSTTVEDIWKDEQITLEAIFGDRYSVVSSTSCSIKLQLDKVPAVVFRNARGYPKSAVPIIAIHSAHLPAYIRLSATQQAVTFAKNTLLGDSNMIFALVEYLEMNLPRIIENPGSLLELRVPGARHSITGALQSASTKEAPRWQPQRREMYKKPQAHVSNTDLLRSWELRQETAAQKKMLKSRQALPAWLKQESIVDAVQRNQCTIISGETGSGKSTQSVQFILDHMINSLQGTSAKIVCTQPRRISALGLSDRVSAERCSEEGQEVGYIIRGDSRVSADTKITFMTTGVLLRRLQSSADLETALADLSHIFVDEVHERSLDTDFLLSLIRDALKVRKNLKLILMSATLDGNLFVDYFGGKSKVGLVHIEGRTFPVTDYYLDDVVRFTKAGHSSMTMGNEDDGDDYFDPGKAIMSLGAGINYALISDLVAHIDSELGTAEGGVLIFLPGTLEIERCLQALRQNSGLLPLPLHASLTPLEQKRVFPVAPKGKRKVIACTNVAETSITIEDIVAVIDTGRVKETRYGESPHPLRISKADQKVADGIQSGLNRENCSRNAAVFWDVRTAFLFVNNVHVLHHVYLPMFLSTSLMLPLVQEGVLYIGTNLHVQILTTIS